MRDYYSAVIRDARTPPHGNINLGNYGWVHCDCESCNQYYAWEAYADELTEAWDLTHCESCGTPYQWHGRDEADRRCPSCRYQEELSE